MKKVKTELFRYCRLIILIVCINVFVVSIATVHGTSMFPTLHDKDVLIVLRLGYKPDYGDIVVTDADNNLNINLVKRVIGLAGDVISFDSDGYVYVNGEKSEYNFDNCVYGDIKYPYTVPEDSVFLMGDNRNSSFDSRFQKVGSVKLENIIGKSLIDIPFGKVTDSVKRSSDRG